eukprot:4826323-Ditylum_brightwellii.AAC.1
MDGQCEVELRIYELQTIPYPLQNVDGNFNNSLDWWRSTGAAKMNEDVAAANIFTRENVRILEEHY